MPPQCTPSPGSERGCWTPCQEEGDGAGRGGVTVLVEFLATTLEACGRAAESLRRPRKQPRTPEEEAEAEQRAEGRLQLLQILFVDNALIPNLFKLLAHSTAQFESASLLHALLQHLLNPRRCPGSELTEPLITQYLPHIDLLGSLLLRCAQPRSGGPLRRPHEQQRVSRRQVRLNAYTVREPLGPLRVAAVQILVAVCELAPERAFPLVKPAVWGLLVQWFLLHRCNHIFQAACGRLWILLVHHGSARLQHLVLVKFRLLSGLCDAVLAEGACGDRWHELRAVRGPGGGACDAGIGGLDADSQPSSTRTGARTEKSLVAVCRNRHPGGLGGIVPVVVALAETAKAAAMAEAEAIPLTLEEAPSFPRDPAEAQVLARALAGHGLPPAERTPLGERVVPQFVQAAMKSEEVSVKKPAQELAPPPCYVAQLLAAMPLWPQVLGAVGGPQT